MNEVTRIHLGRQQFIVAVDAHKALQTYLHAIERQVDNDTEVTKEVELRIAELLAERGAHGDTVVLKEDITYVRQQLGEPSAFGETDGDAHPKPAAEPQAAARQKRLFRDTDNAILAGVCSGLANFLGVDPIVVRLIFVLVTLTGGAGIFIYIVLWLLLPAATTSSDKLQMRGKPVTVDTLKEIVANADVEGATRRASKYLKPIVHRIVSVIRRIVGVVFAGVGVAGLVGVGIVGSLVIIRHDWLLTSTIFPKTEADIALIALGLSFIGLLMTFLILAGASIVKRAWVLKGWVTGALLGIALLILAIGTALAIDASPRIRETYRNQYHTINRTTEPFQRVAVDKAESIQQPVAVQFMVIPGEPYTVSYRYNGKTAPHVKTEVKDGVLDIDVRDYDPDTNCTGLCLFHDPILRVTVTTPTALQSQ